MRKEILRCAMAIGLGMLIAVGVRNLVAEAFEVPSGSMEDTISIGARVIGEKVSYLFRDPARGEIVTFVDPENEDKLLVKRIIGLPGDVVEFSGGKVWINGKVLDEPYVVGETYPLQAMTNYAGVSIYTLGEDEYFMMGDNREDSQDSRVFGPVKRDAILTHVVVCFWPLDKIALL